MIATERHPHCRQERVPPWLGAAMVGGTFLTLVWLESRRPLRGRRFESKFRRNVRNLAVAATAAAAVQLAERPLTAPLTRLVGRRRLGLLPGLRLPRWLEVALGVILLDYTLYFWHVLTHKVPFLWRFHKAHHADLDMDASTAVRFHFGEIAISALYRAGQVLLLGIRPLTLSVWGTLLMCEVMFHHSNVSLPRNWERWLGKLLVTPRMHGIHHSTARDETDSNWSSGLTLWDWLHGTLRRDVPQDRITIGVPEYREPNQVTLPRVLAMPLDGDAGFHPLDVNRPPRVNPAPGDTEAGPGRPRPPGARRRPVARGAEPS